MDVRKHGLDLLWARITTLGNSRKRFALNAYMDKWALEVRAVEAALKLAGMDGDGRSIRVR